MNISAHSRQRTFTGPMPGGGGTLSRDAMPTSGYDCDMEERLSIVSSLRSPRKRSPMRHRSISQSWTILNFLRKHRYEAHYISIINYNIKILKFFFDIFVLATLRSV